MAGDYKIVWVQWTDNNLDQFSYKVIVDKLGRVYLPLSMLGNGKRKTVKGISFSSDRAGIIPVQHTEPRYEGDQMKYLVCTLRSAP